MSNSWDEWGDIDPDWGELHRPHSSNDNESIAESLASPVLPMREPDTPAMHKILLQELPFLKPQMPNPPRHSVAALQDAPEYVVAYIGPKRTKYRIQKDYLIYHSEFFKAALSGTWKESENGTIELEEIEPSVFNIFIEWLHTQVLPDFDELNEWHEIVGSIKFKSPIMHLLKLYVFTDRFLVPSLRAQVNRAILGNTTFSGRPTLYPEEVITFAFANLPSNDPLLDFFVDAYFMEWRIPLMSTDKETKVLSQMPHEFWFRFVLRVGKFRGIWGQGEYELKMDYASYYLRGSDAGKERREQERREQERYPEEPHRRNKCYSRRESEMIWIARDTPQTEDKVDTCQW